MDEQYELRNFQDAKVVKQATVTIDNVEHEVTPAQVQGKRLSSDDLNYMDRGIFNLHKNKISKTVIELLAVSETAPTTCNTGDLYYNKTTKLIYEATGQNVWSNEGQAPADKYLYADLTDSKLYYYDGTDFKSYGGGNTGSVMLKKPSGNVPTTILIDPDLPLNNVGSEVTDSLDGNQTNMAPSVRVVKDVIVGKELFASEKGSNGEIPLSDDHSKYRRLIIDYKDNNNQQIGSIEIDCKFTSFSLSHIFVNPAEFYLFTALYSMDKNKLIPTLANCGLYRIGEQKRETGTNYFYITKVIGYK